MNESARYGLLVVGSIAFALVVGGGTWLALRYVDAHGLGGARTAQRQKKEYRKVLAEDLRVTRHGVPGVDLLRCGICRLEKRKKGPLTLGGMNVLVMEDLSVVLPPEDSPERLSETPYSSEWQEAYTRTTQAPAMA